MMADPIPSRDHLKRCVCGKRPRVGTTFEDMHRVACMKLSGFSDRPYGCGLSTEYFHSKQNAERTWNDHFGE